MLPNHNGKCRNLHGHNYVVLVTICGELNSIGFNYSDEGMVIDFAEVTRIWKETLEPLLDHTYLNDTLPSPARAAPTAELVAAFIFERFAEYLNTGSVITPSIEEVTLWETETSSATVSR